MVFAADKEGYLSVSAISLEDAEESHSVIIDDFVDSKILYFHYYEEGQLFVVSKCGHLALYNVTTNDEDEVNVQRQELTPSVIPQ